MNHGKHLLKLGEVYFSPRTYFKLQAILEQEIIINNYLLNLGLG